MFPCLFQGNLPLDVFFFLGGGFLDFIESNSEPRLGPKASLDSHWKLFFSLFSDLFANWIPAYRHRRCDLRLQISGDEL